MFARHETPELEKVFPCKVRKGTERFQMLDVLPTKGKVISSLGMAVGMGLVYLIASRSMEDERPPEAWAAYDPYDWPDVVLFNYARFAHGGEVFGYASCLIELDSGQVIGATTLGILIEDREISRDHPIDTLRKDVSRWELIPVGNAGTNVWVKGVFGSTDKYRKVSHSECVLMTLERPSDGWPVTPLHLRTGMPASYGDSLYVISSTNGLPGGVQTVYPAEVTDSAMGIYKVRLLYWTNPDDLLGAPVLNESGHLEGIVIRETRLDDPDEPGGLEVHSVRKVVRSVD